MRIVPSSFKPAIVGYVKGKDIYYDGMNHYIKTQTGSRISIDFNEQIYK